MVHVQGRLKRLFDMMCHDSMLNNREGLKQKLDESFYVSTTLKMYPIKNGETSANLSCYIKF